MSKIGLHRHYDRLSGEERFRLDVLAMARGDAQESERLVRSCPRATYTTNDRAFTARWGASENITLRVCAPLLQELGRLRVVDAFRVLAPYQDTLNEDLALGAYYRGHEAGSYHAWNHAGKTGHPPAWPKGDDPEEIWEPEGDEADAAMQRDADELVGAAKINGGFLPEILDRLEREVVAQALTVWAGYAAFCDERAGVPAEKLAAVVLEPIMEQIGGPEGAGGAPGCGAGRRDRRGATRGARADVALGGGAGHLMGRLGSRLERLEREAEGEMVFVSQTDGTVARFPQSAGAEALVALTSGRDHPLARAARSSPDPEWANSLYNAVPMDPGAEDLSEP